MFAIEEWNLDRFLTAYQCTLGKRGEQEVETLAGTLHSSKTGDYYRLSVTLSGLSGELLQQLLDAVSTDKTTFHASFTRGTSVQNRLFRCGDVAQKLEYVDDLLGEIWELSFEMETVDQ